MAENKARVSKVKMNYFNKEGEKSKIVVNQTE
jgi:hypothetical protein